jgi:hypothetical protein
MRLKPSIIPGILKSKDCIVIRVINDLFLIPRVLRTANSYFLSSTSVCIKENIRMKLRKHMKNITVAKTLLSMYSIILFCSIESNMGASLLMSASRDIFLII